jgi:probable HAF family extracellular repeat protein
LLVGLVQPCTGWSDLYLRPFGINAYGQIVGGYADGTGTRRGFLATPTKK